MIDWIHAGPTVVTAFLGSLVECVEALTIVLAVGTVRGWRSALLGTAGTGRPDHARRDPRPRARGHSPHRPPAGHRPSALAVRSQLAAQSRAAGRGGHPSP